MQGLWRRQSWAGPLAEPAATALAVLVGGLAMIGVIVKEPRLYRPVLAAALVFNLVVVARRWPRAAIATTLMLLPFLALLRRLLISPAGWTGNDPLLLVAPLLAIYLIGAVYVMGKRPVPKDWLTKLVIGLVVFSGLQAFNPSSHSGLLAGLAGLLFLAIPLLWFLLGQHFGTRRLVALLLAGAVVLAVVVAGYGLWQTRIRTSVPSWDLSWIHITGYQALYVGGHNVAIQVRPFSTFSSNAEYSAFISSGIIIALGFALRRRVLGLVAVPVLGYALFYAGGRTVIVLTLVGAVTLFALSTRRLYRGVVVFLAGIALAVGAGSVFGSSLDRAATASSDAITQRNVSGILNPFSSKTSTLSSHFTNLTNGITAGIQHPLGQGDAATNLAGARVSGAGTIVTDNDIADVFISLGLLGGAAYLVVIVLIFRRVFSAYGRRKDVLLLIIGGLLVGNFEHWLQGGYYAVAPLFWFVVGWACRQEPAGHAPAISAESARSGVRRLTRPVLSTPPSTAPSPQHHAAASDARRL
jgi:hypothetical protein